MDLASSYWLILPPLLLCHPRSWVQWRDSDLTLWSYRWGAAFCCLYGVCRRCSIRTSSWDTIRATWCCCSETWHFKFQGRIWGSSLKQLFRKCINRNKDSCEGKGRLLALKYMMHKKDLLYWFILFWSEPLHLQVQTYAKWSKYRIVRLMHTPTPAQWPHTNHAQRDIPNMKIIFNPRTLFYNTTPNRLVN